MSGDSSDGSWWTTAITVAGTAIVSGITFLGGWLLKWRQQDNAFTIEQRRLIAEQDGKVAAFGAQIDAAEDARADKAYVDMITSLRADMREVQADLRAVAKARDECAREQAETRGELRFLMSKSVECEAARADRGDGGIGASQSPPPPAP